MSVKINTCLMAIVFTTACGETDTTSTDTTEHTESESKQDTSLYAGSYDWKGVYLECPSIQLEADTVLFLLEDYTFWFAYMCFEDVPFTAGTPIPHIIRN